jgi:hypothetical protein
MKRAGMLSVGVIAVFAVGLMTASAHAAKFKFFQSPSGNIGCVITKQAVRCDIREHTWPTPPRPPDCDVDYGGGVQVARNERGSYVCAGDTALDPSADILGYGDRIRKGAMRCASKSKGMRCVDVRSKHGFFLSRDVVRLF